MGFIQDEGAIKVSEFAHLKEINNVSEKKSSFASNIYYNLQSKNVTRLVNNEEFQGSAN